jgi:integrase
VGSSLAEARIEESKKKVELKEKGGVRKNILLKDYMEKYYLPHHYSRNVSPRVDAFKFVIDRFGDKYLDKVSPAEVELAILERTANIKPGTYNLWIAIIKRIFNYAVELGILGVSPVKLKKKRVEGRIRFLTHEEADRLLEACKKHKHWYETVYIALYTGLRKREIRTLRSEDVRDGMLYVRAEVSKSKKVRRIPLTKELTAFFETAGFNYDFVFDRAFRRIVRSLGIKDFHFHDLRHTFASWLVQKGVDLYIVKELLGHSSIVMTQRYAHLTRQHLDAAMEKLFKRD